MNAESRKKALRHFYTQVVEPLGFKFTPDADLADFLLEQEVKLEAQHGIPFCPCQPLRHERARDPGHLPDAMDHGDQQMERELRPLREGPAARAGGHSDRVSRSISPLTYPSARSSSATSSATARCPLPATRYSPSRSSSR